MNWLLSAAVTLMIKQKCAGFGRLVAPSSCERAEGRVRGETALGIQKKAKQKENRHVSQLTAVKAEVVMF